MVRINAKTATRAAGFLLAAQLAACASPSSQPWNAPLPEDQFPITVRATHSMAEVSVEPGQEVLSYPGRDALASIGSEYLATGQGAIVLAVPVGGANAESAVVVGAEARDRLAAIGISYRDIQGAAYDAQGRDNAPIVVMIDRYVAEAAPCHRIWDDFARTTNGQNTRNFGCATQANLAAVIRDPGDLVAPHAESAPDAGRRGTVFGLYRQGQTTVTKRSESEGTQVSDAVNN